MNVRAISRMAVLIVGLALLALCMSGTACAKGYVYITTQEGYIFCYDANNYSQIASFSTNGHNQMTASPDGRWIYLAGHDDIQGFNTTSFVQDKYIPYERHENIEDMAMGDDDRIYVATMSRYIKAYDASTCERVNNAAVFMTANPYKLELSPDNSRLYVAACHGGDLGAYYTNDFNLSVYNANNMSHIRTRHISMTIEGIAASPDGSSLYVIGHNSSTGSKNTKVLKLRASDLATQKTAYGSGIWPWDIVVSPDGDHLYVSEYDNDTILVFNSDTFALERSVAVGERPMLMDISPNGKKLYIASRIGELRVMDTTTFNVNNIGIGDESSPVDIKYVNVGPSIMQFYGANLTFATPTPRPTIMGLIFNMTSVSATPVPSSASGMPTSEPSVTSSTGAPTPSPGAATSPPVDGNVTSLSEASPGVSSTASAGPVSVSTPGFSGPVAAAAITLVAGALLGRGRNKKER